MNLHDQPEFSILLRQLMEERGYSMDKLAAASGVHRSTIYRWRQGLVGRAYALDSLLKVARALNLDRITASRLLRAANQPPLETLEQTIHEGEILEILNYWRGSGLDSLPAELTSFHGRERDLEAVTDLLQRQGARLVTLTGPGGAGKTRLALRLASGLRPAYPDGVLYVPLESVTDPAQVLPAIARRAGLREAPRLALSDQLARHFSTRSTLLVLDNFEHLLAAGPEIVALLKATRELVVLATSRIRLHISGEHVYFVGPFEVPPEGTPLEELAASPPLAIFADRARAVNSSLEIDDEGWRVVRRICELVDGIPLAIQLAAARCGQFPLDELLARFPTALELASDGPRDAADRQRTLRETVAWSFELLPEEERRLLADLAVFIDGWDLEAAAYVRGVAGNPGPAEVGPAIGRLAQTGLVQQEGEPGRYRLFGTIREYLAEQQGGEGDRAGLRRRHAGYFLNLVEDAGEIYVPGIRDTLYIRRVHRAYADVLAALEWTRDHDPRMMARFAAALWPYWHEHGIFSEGRGWIGEVGDAADQPPERAARLLTGELLLAYSQADYPAASEAGEEALDRWTALGDLWGQAISWLYLGQTHFVTGRVESAGHSLARSLGFWRSLAHPPGIGRCLAELAILLTTTGQGEAAIKALGEAKSIHEESGYVEGVARCEVDLGLAQVMSGRLDLALEQLERGIALAREAEAEATLSYGLFYLGAALCFAGELDAARAPLEESLRRQFATLDRYGGSFALLGFFTLARRQGNHERAARLAGAVNTLLEQTGIAMNPGMRKIYDSEMDEVRQALGAGFERAFDSGRQLDFAGAVAEALNG